MATVMPSRSATERSLPEKILVGRLLRPHGLRGEIKVEIHSDYPERFEPGSELIATLPRRPAQRLRVRLFRLVRGGGLVAFKGYETRDQAEELRGARLEIERSRVPKAPPGSFYHYELEGCHCFDEEHGELGQVTDVIEDGGGHLLQLSRGGDHQLLVPFVKAFLVQVDIEEGRIDLRLPEGLVEICESES